MDSKEFINSRSKISSLHCKCGSTYIDRNFFRERIRTSAAQLMLTETACFVFRLATTQHLLVVQAVNLCSLERRAKIESRANAGRFSFTATGFTQASGIAPLRELKLLLDETHDYDINSDSSSLARSTIYLGEIYLRERRGKSRWTPWPFRLSQLTLGLAIRRRNPPVEAGPRTWYFHGYKGGIGY